MEEEEEKEEEEEETPEEAFGGHTDKHDRGQRYHPHTT